MGAEEGQTGGEEGRLKPGLQNNERTRTTNQTTNMAKTISITIPDVLHAALRVEGKDLEQEPGEVIKSFLLSAYRCPDGAVLNLQPAVLRPDPNQSELPLQ